MRSAWPRAGLWRDGEFLRLWGAQAISELGSRITVLALPLAAILVVHASVLEVALLRTVEVAPLLLFALPAGVWIDRVRRRPLMIAADIGQGLALASIPIAYWTGSVSLVQLYAVAFVVGALALVFDLAYLSFLPSLVPPERLSDGNAKLEATRAGAELVGPTFGGALVGLVTAPVAILADAVSFAVSAALVGSIRRSEPTLAVERRHLLTELAEGVRYVFGQPYLRTLTIWSAAWNLFNAGFMALMIVYLVRGLGLSATTVGWILGLGSLGGLAGAMLSRRVVARFGIGPTIAVSGVLSSLGIFGVPLAPHAFPQPVVVAGEMVATGFGMLFNVNQLTLRQAITPSRLMGRMNSVVRLMYWGTIPAGAAIGGALASWIGLRPTLWIEAVGATVVMIPLLFSPLYRLRRPEEVAALA
jgi:MFS family permease